MKIANNTTNAFKIPKEVRAKHGDNMNKKLLDLTGLDFQKIRKNHTMVGTEEPILYEFSNLILNKNIKSIVEFGCGMSTLWFTYLASLNPNINCISYEDSDQWKIECEKLIKQKIGLIPNIKSVSKSPILPLNKVDLLFVDGLDRINTLKNNINNLLHKDTIIYFDDAIIYDDITKEPRDLYNPYPQLKYLIYKNIYYFWSRDRVLCCFDNNNYFNKKEQLYWTVK